MAIEQIRNLIQTGAAEFFQTRWRNLDSIRSKILAMTIAVVLMSFLAISLAGAISIAGIYTTLRLVLSSQSEDFLNVLKQNSERSQAKLVKVFEENTHKIGENMVKKDSLILKSSFQEYAFGAIRSNLKNSFAFDPLILLANFIVIEDGEVKSWQYLDRKHPDGLNLPIRYSAASQSWIAGSDSAVEVPDPRALDIRNIKKMTIQRIAFQSEAGDLLPAIEVISPMFDGDEKDIDQFLKDGEPVGYLRYVISMEQLTRAIDTEKKELEAALTNQEKASAGMLDAANIKVLSGISLSLLLQIATGIIVIFLATGIAALLSRILSRPIDDLSKASEAIASGNYDADIETSGKDEVGQLSRNFDAMRIQVRKFTLHLQDLVAERTLELKSALTTVTEKSQKIREIMVKIDQGIFTIDSDHKIEKEYSLHLESMYPSFRGKIPGMSYSDLLFDHSDLSGDVRAFIEATVRASIGTMDFSWTANSDQLPRRIHYRWPEGSELTFDISWSAIIEDDIVHRLLICIRDITEELKREEQLQKQKEESSKIFDIISQIIRLPRKNFVTRMTECDDHLKALASTDKVEENFRAIYIHLHTIKGISRSMGFIKLTESVHQAEHIIYEHLQSGVPIDIPALGLANLDVEREFGFVVQQAKEVLKIDFSDQVHQHSNLFSALADPISDVLDLCSHSNLANEHVVVDDRVSQWQADFLSELSQAARHALSNSLDHGYLKPIAKGKPVRKFAIKIIADETADSIVISFQDQGYGFDWDAIRSRAQAAGLSFKNNSELLQLTLREGFSTAENVTEISGRGAGLSALQDFSHKLGGSINLADNPGGGSLVVLEFPRFMRNRLTAVG